MDTLVCDHPIVRLIKLEYWFQKIAFLDDRNCQQRTKGFHPIDCQTAQLTIRRLP